MVQGLQISQSSIQDEEPIEEAMNGREQSWEIVDINFSMVGRSLKHLNQVIQLYKLYDFFCLSRARYDKFRYDSGEGAMYPSDKNNSDI